MLAKFVPASLILLAPVVALADIHDEMHTCIHDRLPQLKSPNWNSESQNQLPCQNRALASIAKSRLGNRRWPLPNSTGARINSAFGNRHSGTGHLDSEGSLLEAPFDWRCVGRASGRMARFLVTQTKRARPRA